MDFVPELAKLGVVGLVAALFLWLYLGERKEHAKTSQLLIDSILARLADSQKNMSDVTIPLNSISQGITSLGDKIELGKRQR